MRFKIIYFLLLLFCIFSAFGQRTLSGRVIGEDLETPFEIKIFNQDTTEIGKTDFNGYFKIELTKETENLIFAGLGYEWSTISIPENCNYLEIILLFEYTYDFMSSNKIDRLRKKRFEKLPDLRKQAFQDGLFMENKKCFIQHFEPYKPELDKIEKQLKELSKENKRGFKRLEVGDTITIPFSGTYKYDGSERTSLFVYSYIVEGEDFDCKIKGVVTKKQKNRKGYFLTYKVTETNNCKFKSIIYNDKPVEVGQIFEQNMKYFKVIID